MVVIVIVIVIVIVMVVTVTVVMSVIVTAVIADQGHPTGLVQSGCANYRFKQTVIQRTMTITTMTQQ